MCVVVAAGLSRAADGPLLSIIADREPGPAASHGVRSLTAALKAKDVACETVRSAQEARGRVSLVAGLTPGGEAGQYQATVPGEHVVPAFDFMYFVEGMDTADNGGIYPDLNKERPYIIVRLER